MIKLKTHIRIALFYFLLAAILGVVLRSFYSVAIPVNYKFFVHTHSHIALLGWVYMALTTLLYKLYLDKLNLDKKYRRIFWFTQLTLLGMLLTFPFQGYALFSIVFSTLFLFASYWFAWFFLKHTPTILKKTNSYTCIRIALWYLVVSSLGPWVLGVIMNTLGAQSIWYRLAIYFYLHFLYNGWMILALIGIVLYIFEERKISLSDKIFKRFFWSLNLGVVLTFFLSTLFTNPSILLYVLGGAGALLQLYAFRILLMKLAGPRERSGLMLSPFQYGLLKTIAVLLGIKMLLQLLTALPYFANLAATVLDFTIGYLHWTFLGVVSISLFLFFDYFKLMKISKKGYFLYLIGFFVTEGLIFYKGIVVWLNSSFFDIYFDVLAVGSLLIPLSLVFILATNWKGR
ncbi:MAG: hypothetical protein QM485_03965 [Flavobacteriaceae bacterium]